MKTNWPWNNFENNINYDPKINWPRITIVTPSYNQGKYIEETILSVLNQHYPNLEYIIIDGGSTDSTLEIIEKYKSQINYFISEPDEGQSDAIIKGFSRATGDIYNWINSDDILVESALLNVAKAFLDNDIDFMHSKNAIIDEHSNIIGYMPNYKDNLNLRYIYEMPHGQQSAFFSAKIYRKVNGINPILKFSMDYELYVKMHLLCCKSMRFDFLAGCIRNHEMTKTNNLRNVMITENGNIFKTALEKLGYYNESKSLNYLGNTSYNFNFNINLELSKSEIKKMIVLYYKKLIWNFYNAKNKKTRLIMSRIFINQPLEIFNLTNIKILKDSLFF